MNRNVSIAAGAGFSLGGFLSSKVARFSTALWLHGCSALMLSAPMRLPLPLFRLQRWQQWRGLIRRFFVSFLLPAMIPCGGRS